VAGALLLSLLAPRPLPAAEWPPVAPVDTAKIHPGDFADDELDLPFYLVHFHRLANAVVPSGETRGFIDLPVYRGAEVNKPYNARIMENILSFAFFYATKRPWNPYYADPAVRVRLEAALDYWCSLQHTDGRFAEYFPREWNLAATAFATKFMGRTLTLLRDGPPIEDSVHQRAIQADRKALLALLNDPELYEHGKKFTNQYTNTYAGGFELLALYPDAALRARLVARLQESSRLFQSPAGYFYEERGPDFGYNIDTQHSNLWITWDYNYGNELAAGIVEEERRFFEWYSYNAVLEPGRPVFTLNRAVETRQRHAVFDVAEGSQRLMATQDVPAAHAFLSTVEELKEHTAAARLALTRSWPQVRELNVGHGDYNPYVFLHRTLRQWHPTDAQRQAARAALPYMRRERFVHQRADDRQPVVFTYVRRPAYYAAFNSGALLTRQQRLGLGLLWTPGTGAVLQSQTGSADAAWGTRAAGQPLVYEAETLQARILVDGTEIPAVAGGRDLADGTLAIRYSLGDRGDKSLTFADRAIAVSIRHPGEFREQVPLVVAQGDQVRLEDGRTRLVRKGRTVLTVVHTGRATLEDAPLDARLADDAPRVSVVVLAGRDRLEYRLVLGEPGTDL
jgi:hypothetical protein